MNTHLHDHYYNVTTIGGTDISASIVSLFLHRSKIELSHSVALLTLKPELEPVRDLTAGLLGHDPPPNPISALVDHSGPTAFLPSFAAFSGSSSNTEPSFAPLCDVTVIKENHLSLINV